MGVSPRNAHHRKTFYVKEYREKIVPQGYHISHILLCNRHFTRKRCLAISPTSPEALLPSTNTQNESVCQNWKFILLETEHISYNTLLSFIQIIHLNSGKILPLYWTRHWSSKYYFYVTHGVLSQMPVIIKTLLWELAGNITGKKVLDSFCDIISTIATPTSGARMYCYNYRYLLYL